MKRLDNKQLGIALVALVAALFGINQALPDGANELGGDGTTATTTTTTTAEGMPISDAVPAQTYTEGAAPDAQERGKESPDETRPDNPDPSTTSPADVRFFSASRDMVPTDPELARMYAQEPETFRERFALWRAETAQDFVDRWHLDVQLAELGFPPDEIPQMLRDIYEADDGVREAFSNYQLADLEAAHTSSPVRKTTKGHEASVWLRVMWEACSIYEPKLKEMIE